MMIYVGALIGIVAFVFGVLLIRSIARDAGEKPGQAVAASVSLSVVAFLALAVMGYASPLYKLNTIALGGIVVVGALFVGVSAWLGVLLHWKWKGILKVVGMFSSMVLIAGMLSMYMTMWDLPQLTAGQQIADEFGFTFLVAPDWKLSDGYWPVTALEKEQGVKLDYTKFQLVERAADGDLNPDDLRAVASPGKTLFDEVQVPSTSTETLTQVNGRPALYLLFNAGPPAAEKDKGGKSEGTAVLVTQVEDDLIIIWNSTAMLWEQGMTGAPDVFTEEDMVQIAGSLEPYK